MTGNNQTVKRKERKLESEGSNQRPDQLTRSSSPVGSAASCFELSSKRRVLSVTSARCSSVAPLWFQPGGLMSSLVHFLKLVRQTALMGRDTGDELSWTVWSPPSPHPAPLK